MPIFPTNKLVNFLALFCCSGLLLCLLLFPLTSIAAFTKQINYQGKLTNSSGVAVADTSYTMVFTLYDAPTGGNVVWTETDIVSTQGGLFSLMLGAGTSLDNVNFNQPLYLGLKVNSDAEMTPRKTLGAVASSFTSARLDGNASSTNIDVSNYLNVSGNLTAGSITLGGVTRSTWPSGGGAGGLWATSTDSLVAYPDMADPYAIVIGGSSTTTNGSIFEVQGISALATTTFSGDINLAAGKFYKYNGIDVIKASTTLNNYFFGNSGNLSMEGMENVGIGFSSLENNTTGDYNVTLGNGTLSSNLTGHWNTAIGSLAMSSNVSGGLNVAVGKQTLSNNISGSNNVAIGDGALYFNSSANNNIGIGSYSLKFNTSGNNNVALGNNAGLTSVGDDNLFLGTLSDVSDLVASTSNKAIAIGYNAKVGGSNMMALGGTSTDAVLVGIGTSTPNAFLNIYGSSTDSDLFRVATSTNQNILLVDKNGQVGIGITASTEALDVLGNIQVNGNLAAYKLNGVNLAYGSTSNNNYFFGNSGNSTMNLAGGGDNISFGFAALRGNVSGAANQAIGTGALVNNLTGSFNSAMGQSSLFANEDGFSNVAVGGNSLQNNVSGSYNTALGFYSGINSIGSENLYLGYLAGVIDEASTTALTNATAIGPYSVVGASNSLILGGLGASVVNVGIGTSTPNAILNIYSSSTDKDLFRVANSNNQEILFIDMNGLVKIAGTASTTDLVVSNGITLGGVTRTTWPSEGSGVSDWQVVNGKLTPTSTIDILASANFDVSAGSAYRYNGIDLIKASTTLFNYFIGQGAGNLTATSSGNIGIGAYSLSSINSGDSIVNVGIGSLTLASTTSGGANTALGTNALWHNLTGNDNVAVGGRALEMNVSGSKNVVAGLGALYFNTTGSDNVAIGTAAGRNSYYIIEPGDGDSVSDSYMTFLGQLASRDGSKVASTTSLFKGVAIGYNAKVGSSSAMALGGTGADAVRVGIGTSTPEAFLDIYGTYTSLANSAYYGQRSVYNFNPLATSNYPQYGSYVEARANNLSGVNLNGGVTGLAAYANNYSTGNTSSLYGLVGGTNNYGSGTVTNAYGLYLASTTGTVTNNYGVYQDGANTKNYLAGTLSIGTSTDIWNYGPVTDEKSSLTIQKFSATSSAFTILDVNGTPRFEMRMGGSQNTFLGLVNGYSNTTGHGNTGVGSSILGSNTTGYDNTAIGVANLTSNTTGSSNATVGAWSMNHNISGNYNTAVGVSSLFSIETGNANTAVGYGALWGRIGTEAMSSTTALGYLAGMESGLGSKNLFLGVEADLIDELTYNNASAIGYMAKVGGSNMMVLGAAAGTGNEVNVGIGTTTPWRDLSVVGDGVITGNMMVNSITLGGITRSTWPGDGGGSSGTIWATSTPTIVYPTLADPYAIVIGSSATTSNLSIFEVHGTSTMHDLIPDTNLTYNLGDSTHRWNSVWTGYLNLGTSTWSLGPANDGSFAIYDQPNLSGNRLFFAATGTDSGVNLATTTVAGGLSITGNSTTTGSFDVSGTLGLGGVYINNWSDLGSVGGGGNPFDQWLDSTSSPQFNRLTVDSIVLGGVERTFWPTGGGGDGVWATSSDNLVVYPDIPVGNAVVIGANATSSEAGAVFEVHGNTYMSGITSSGGFDFTSIVETSSLINLGDLGISAGLAVRSTSTDYEMSQGYMNAGIVGGGGVGVLGIQMGANGAGVAGLDMTGYGLGGYFMGYKGIQAYSDNYSDGVAGYFEGGYGEAGYGTALQAVGLIRANATSSIAGLDLNNYNFSAIFETNKYYKVESFDYEAMAGAVFVANSSDLNSQQTGYGNIGIVAVEQTGYGAGGYFSGGTGIVVEGSNQAAYFKGGSTGSSDGSFVQIDNYGYGAGLQINQIQQSGYGLVVNGLSNLATTSMAFNSFIGNEAQGYMKVENFYFGTIASGSLGGGFPENNTPSYFPLISFSSPNNGVIGNSKMGAINSGLFILEDSSLNLNPTLSFASADVLSGPTFNVANISWGTSTKNLIFETGDNSLITFNDSFDDPANTVKVGINAVSPRTALDVFGEVTISSLETNGAVYSNNGLLTNTSPSSAEYKSNIATTSLNIDALLNLQVKSFSWNNNGQADYGLIAEEIKEVLPELYREDGSTKGYRQDHLSFYLLQIAQRQEAEIKALKATLGADSLSVGSDGSLSFKNIKADNIIAENGVTIRDRGTGGYTCVYVENGSIKTSPGECFDSQGLSGTSSGEADPVLPDGQVAGTSTNVLPPEGETGYGLAP